MNRLKKSKATYPDGVLGIYDVFEHRLQPSHFYTVVYTPYEAGGKQWFPTVHMSDKPYHLEGLCALDTYPYRITSGWSTRVWLGRWVPNDIRLRLIDFLDLPGDCQRVVAVDLSDEPVWDLCQDYEVQQHLSSSGFRLRHGWDRSNWLDIATNCLNPVLAARGL